MDIQIIENYRKAIEDYYRKHKKIIDAYESQG
jgi:hypothetical protein